jgi:hypothetical protein
MKINHILNEESHIDSAIIAALKEKGYKLKGRGDELLRS